MEVSEDAKVGEDSVVETKGADTEPKKTVIAEDDMLWLGNCSIKGFEQRRLV